MLIDARLVGVETTTGSPGAKRSHRFGSRDGHGHHVLRGGSNPIADDEEHQITYVALSRAKSELFVYCPDEDRVAEFASPGFKHVETVSEPTTM